jgi:hypothetical protein
MTLLTMAGRSCQTIACGAVLMIDVRVIRPGDDVGKYLTRHDLTFT